MRVERRDHQRRAATLQRVLTWIVGETSAVREVPPSIAPPDAGRRILRRLAFRGLIRRIRRGWIATRVLMTRTELQHEAANEATASARGERRDVGRLQCPRCRKAGVVRFENVVQGDAAERHFFCWECDYSWAVADRRISQQQ
jgi:hypothetical protein